MILLPLSAVKALCNQDICISRQYEGLLIKATIQVYKERLKVNRIMYDLTVVHRVR